MAPTSTIPVLKMAIVSSYDESCGIASFTKILTNSIQSLYKNVQVTVFPLDLDLLQSVERSIRRDADRYIDKLSKDLNAFDLVNIQIEYGLYGAFPRDIVRRLERLFTSNKNTVITLHTVHLLTGGQSAARNAIAALTRFRLREALKALIMTRYQQAHVKISRKAIRMAARHNVRIIVHTLRSKAQILRLFNYSNVDVHPLKLVPQDYKVNNDTLDKIKHNIGCRTDDILIGIFGFISPYKGHMDALKALRHLPQNYKLLIFGRQHPRSIRSDGSVDPYLAALQKFLKKSNLLRDRVFFLGELADLEFMDVVSRVDACWLPYYENGQDGSGIASLCVDLAPRVLCSQSFVFDEMFKLVNHANVIRFDIGNILELALKTKMSMRQQFKVRENVDDETFTIKTQAATYLRQIDPTVIGPNQ